MSFWEASAWQRAQEEAQKSLQNQTQQARRFGWSQTTYHQPATSAVDELKARAAALRAKLVGVDELRAELETIEKMLASVEAK